MGRSMYPGIAGLDVLEQVRQGRVTYPREVDPGVPEELEAIVRRATNYDRDSRYQSARELAGALAQFLHQQAVVLDAAALEQLIADLAPRDVTSPDAAKPPIAALPMMPERELTTAPTMAAQDAPDHELRERRHVVVVAGVVRPRVDAGPGPGDLGRTDPGAAGVGSEAVRVLGEIAYKNDAVIDWAARDDIAERRRFRFILGLGRPTVHDPLRATRVALDVLDALAGLSADLVTPLTASIGLSRGVVSTSRDANNRLLRYEPLGIVLEVAERLADEGRPGEDPRRR